MFQHAFQSGAFLEIFDAKVNKEKDKFYQNLYKVINPQGFSREFDKGMKGYLIEVNGNSRAKLQFPKEDRQELALVQHFLVFQILVPIGVPFGVEITVSDTNKNKRRLNFTSSVKEIDKNYFHSKIPVDSIKRGVWLNLSFDILSFFTLFKGNTSFFASLSSMVGQIGQNFRSIDSFVLSGGYKLRKIFTMKNPLLEYNPEGDQGIISNPEAIMVPKTQNFPSGLTYFNQSLSLSCVEKQALTNVEDQLSPGISHATPGLNPEVLPNKLVQVKSLLTDAKEAKPTPVASMQIQKAKINPATRQNSRPEFKKTDQPRKIPKTAEGHRKRENKENINATNIGFGKRVRSGTTTTTASTVTLLQATDSNMSQEASVAALNQKQTEPTDQYRGRRKIKKTAFNPWDRDCSKSKEGFDRSTSKPNLRYSIAEEETKEKEQNGSDKGQEAGDERNTNKHRSVSKEEDSFCRYESLIKQNPPESSKFANVSEQKSQAFNPMNSIRRFGEEFHDMMDDFEDIEERLNSEHALNNSASFIKSANQAAITIKKHAPALPVEKYSVSDLLEQKTQLLQKGGNTRDDEFPKEEDEQDEDILEDSLQAIQNPRTPLDRQKNKYEQQGNNTLPRTQPYSPPFSRVSQKIEQVMNTRGKVTQALIVENYDSDDDCNSDEGEAPEPTRKLDLQKTVQEKLNLKDQKDEDDENSDEDEFGLDCEDDCGKKDAEGEETLNVVFDPVLNCYYHPPTNTYFELKQ